MLGHIFGQAKSAADFWLTNSTSLNLQMKVTDQMPLPEIAIQPEAKTQQVTFPDIKAVNHFSHDFPKDDQFITQLHTHGFITNS